MDGAAATHTRRHTHTHTHTLSLSLSLFLPLSLSHTHTHNQAWCTGGRRCGRCCSMRASSTRTPRPPRPHGPSYTIHPTRLAMKDLRDLALSTQALIICLSSVSAVNPSFQALAGRLKCCLMRVSSTRTTRPPRPHGPQSVGFRVGGVGVRVQGLGFRV